MNKIFFSFRYFVILLLFKEKTASIWGVDSSLFLKSLFHPLILSHFIFHPFNLHGILHPYRLLLPIISIIILNVAYSISINLEITIFYRLE